MSIKADGLAAAVARELAEYRQEVTDGIKADVKQTAKECAAETKKAAGAAFKGTGRYAKGWAAKTAFESESDIRMTVYNKTAPQLTHLLEHGHAKADGGRVEGREHIRPAEEEAAEKLGKRVKVTVGYR